MSLPRVPCGRSDSRGGRPVVRGVDDRHSLVDPAIGNECVASELAGVLHRAA